MFYLEIGLNVEHPVVPWVVDWRDIMEMRLKKRGFSPYWNMGAVSVRWDLPQERFYDVDYPALTDGFIVDKAKSILEASKMPVESIHRVQLWAQGVMMLGVDGNGSVYQFVGEGGGNLYLVSSALSNMRCTYIEIYPFQWPHGLEHTLSSFEHFARGFVYSALTWKRIHDALEQIEKHHNPAAAVAKLKSAKSHLSHLAPLFHEACKHGIESRPVSAIQPKG